MCIAPRERVEVFQSVMGEINCKMGQGRLDATIQVYDVDDFQWQWIPVSYSIYFAGMAISIPPFSGAIEQRQRSRATTAISAEMDQRVRALTAFAGMLCCAWDSVHGMGAGVVRDRRRSLCC